ncbi:hypothetical protein B566_EDAN002861 [Ephemera danica]|nr:hypothetical protein B566_EDAN002861 [Ephemera danica]
MVDAELAKASSLASAKSGLGKNGVVKPSNSTPPSPDSEVEDISDEAVTARHDALEMEERRKFRCPPSTRGLRGRRTDSRAESSGANTPDDVLADPMSPNPVAAEVGDSPMASPRATPLPPAMLQEDSQGSKPGGSKPLASGSKQPSIGLRRRTVSSQRASPEPSTPFYEIAPFEARMFPLQEDIFQRMLAGSDHPPSMPTLAPVLSPESCTDRRRSSIQESSTRTPRTLPSPPPSPCDTDSTESALPEDDDMDPEWTLDSEMVPSPQSASSSSAVRPFRRSQ